jgi:hypothetical protein
MLELVDPFRQSVPPPNRIRTHALDLQLPVLGVPPAHVLAVVGSPRF